MSSPKFIIPHSHTISKKDRQHLNNHNSLIIWFTGLSGSGKSTLANKVEERLHKMGFRTYLLDGDNIRKGLCKDLGFSEEDRAENIRRIGETARLFVEAGIIVLTAFISPFKKERQAIRKLVGRNEFFEIYVNCPLNVCEHRDVKGLYKKARIGMIKNFTGIDSPFEAPVNPDVEIRTDKMNLNDSVKKIMKGLLPKI
ncbi:MAG: adenylyl-sulfate kinase [Bacteroidetes bacterium RIFCSPLOWO2_02_FULL_36_8]|nr:MAG: adenylyl-sulfate kinase [Bacteroidetes bacterium RIFCSPLOWO2_02_FULL_36_8]OFY70998.1 MAG: adenylyl-sulfate kinase [Bacteroidetes bacterium RIFCSPLOWO2_12_FULL_37_12]